MPRQDRAEHFSGVHAHGVTWVMTECDAAKNTAINKGPSTPGFVRAVDVVTTPTATGSLVLYRVQLSRDMFSNGSHLHEELREEFNLIEHSRHLGISEIQDISEFNQPMSSGLGSRTPEVGAGRRLGNVRSLGNPADPIVVRGLGQVVS